MALKWVEGWESYSNLINFIGFRYASFLDSGTSTFVAGRAIGNALNFQGSTITTPNLGNVNEYTVGFAFQSQLSAVNTEMLLLEMRDGVNAQVSLSFNPFTNVFSVWRGNLGGVLLGQGTFAITPGYWYYIELRVFVDPAVGIAQMKVNTVLDVNYSGNTRTTLNSQINAVAWDGPFLAGLGGSYLLDDIYILDSTGSLNNTFLGDMKVEPVTVIDSGFHNDWGVNVPGTPGFQAVQVLNDGLYISSNTPGQEDSFECSSLNFITSNIAGVSAVYWCRNTDSTVHAIQSLVRVSVTDYLGTVIPITNTAFKAYQQIWETDPSTSAPWAVSAVGAAQYGVNLNS